MFAFYDEVAWSWKFSYASPMPLLFYHYSKATFNAAKKVLFFRFIVQTNSLFFTTRRLLRVERIGWLVC